MGKDPAFLFYPNDYIGGTMGMTFEEKGAYMELLMMQFNRGHMTSDMIGQTIGQLWDTVQDKFTQDDKGLWYNKRLEDEQIKRQKFTESRRNNKDGKNQYSDKPPKKTGHTGGRMEDENVNEDIVKKENKKRGKTLFKNSGVTKQDIIDAFQKADDLKIADTDYYYNCLVDSSSKDYMYVDWIATARSWARKDLKDGKIKKKGQKAGTLDSQDRTGRPMTQAQVRDYYEKNGKYPNQ